MRSGTADLSGFLPSPLGGSLAWALNTKVMAKIRMNFMGVSQFMH
jgi:hypothetical protein